MPVSELRCATMLASVWFVLALSLSNLITSYAADCQPLPPKNRIDDFLTQLIRDRGGDPGKDVDVDVLNTTYACQALGTSLGTYRYLSVVVTYMDNAENKMKQGQFEIECRIVSGGSEPGHARAFARPSKSRDNCIHYEL